MPPLPWSTPEQLQFLKKEDAGWLAAKAGSGSLKSFYARTTNTFVQKWPAVPDKKNLEEAEGDAAVAQRLAVASVYSVSMMARLPPLPLT